MLATFLSENTLTNKINALPGNNLLFILYIVRKFLIQPVTYQPAGGSQLYYKLPYFIGIGIFWVTFPRFMLKMTIVLFYLESSGVPYSLNENWKIIFCKQGILEWL